MPTRCLTGLDVVVGGVVGAMSPDDAKEHFKINVVSSVIGAIVGSIVSVILMRRAR